MFAGDSGSVKPLSTPKGGGPGQAFKSNAFGFDSSSAAGIPPFGALAAIYGSSKSGVPPSAE